MKQGIGSATLQEGFGAWRSNPFGKTRICAGWRPGAVKETYGSPAPR
jgi:hypothetical protein